MSDDEDFGLSLRDEDDLFSTSFAMLDESLFDVRTGSLRPLSRVEVNDQFVTVTFDMPGVNSGDISVTCTEDTVSVEGQFSKSFKTSAQGRKESGVSLVRYSKTIQLPKMVDPEKGTAKLKNGIIVVKLPRLETGKQVKLNGPRKKAKGGK